MIAFLALLRRDLLVARRAAPLVFSTLTQPVLMVLVFGNLLPRMGLVAGNFATVFIPGLMSITMMMAGVQGILMPLASDLSAPVKSTSACSRPSRPSGWRSRRSWPAACSRPPRGWCPFPS